MFANDIEVETKTVQANNPANAILDEAQKNYDLMVLGATEDDAKKNELFNPVIDDLVRMAPCPTIVVQAEHPGENWAPLRVLVANQRLASSKKCGRTELLCK